MSSEQPRILKSSSHSSIDFNESQPLLAQTDQNQRYDGTHDHSEDENLRTRSKISRKEASRWPTLISIIITVSLTVAILLLVFIAPSFIEEYAKQAVSIKPTKLSVDSFTSRGLKARVQADFRVDASQVPNKYLRNFGRLSTWIAKEVRSDPSKVQVFLPDYDNLHICTVTVPRIQVDIRDNRTTPLELLIDIALEDKNGIHLIANEWLEGGLDRIQVLVQATISLKSGMISLPAQPISRLLVFEGNKFPKIPRYNITRLNFNEISVPASKINGLAVDASVFIDYNQIIELDMPALGFDMLVQGCGVGNFIQLISIKTDSTHLYPRLGSSFQVKGIITELPQPLLHACPESKLSPLEILIANYVHGNDVNVFIRGSNSPSQSIPDWISEILSKIKIPLTIPSHQYHGLIRNFTISDINFSLPDLFAEPDSDEASPRLSGHLEAIADIPKEINFNVSVTQARASVDVLYKEEKFGELDLYEWQKVKCELIKEPMNPGASLRIKSNVNNAPLRITNEGIFTHIIAALLFRKETVLFQLMAMVDVQISTILGKFLIQDLPAETTVPIKL
ncbi:putative pre-rrna processing protein [Erysiphe neolycopersici]|uniref:Putative pre-rrna processing protein n=1 Tax=Erysiphe neolycopersici TaxID=212602 RepID=A0A420HJV7_9PEZI|nr:putative pre-rrna processing protein [Erysiphe neolycopersici]